MVNLKAQQSALANAIDELYDLGFTTAVNGGLSVALAKKASKKIEQDVLTYLTECSPAEAKAYVASACHANKRWFSKLLKRATGKSERNSMKDARRGQMQVGNLYLRALTSRMNQDDIRYRPLSDVIAHLNFGSYPTLGVQLHMGQVYGPNGPVHTWGPILSNLPADVRLYAIHYSKAKRHADESQFGPAFNGVIALRPAMGGSTLAELGARVDDAPDQNWEMYGIIMLSPKGELLYTDGELRDAHLFATDQKTGKEVAVPHAKGTNCIHTAGVLADWNFPEKFIERTPKGMTKAETKATVDSLCRHNADRVI